MDMAIDLRGFHLPAAFLPRRKVEWSGGGAQAESEKFFTRENCPVFPSGARAKSTVDQCVRMRAMVGAVRRGNERSGGKSTVERAAGRKRKTRVSCWRGVACGNAKDFCCFVHAVRARWRCSSGTTPRDDNQKKQKP